MTGSEDDAWKYNLSGKFYKDRFGNATETAPDLRHGCMEWKRKVHCKGDIEELICCPEDVTPTSKCKHDVNFVCSTCEVPICTEGWEGSMRKRKIPKALANDNFIGYAHSFIVENKVTWLEATIAGPVFSGLVTYYIEGDGSDRHHLIEDTVAKPERSWGVR